MSNAADRHSSDEEVEEVERMIGAPGGLRIHRDDDVDDVDDDDHDEEEENGAETHPMQIHNDHDMAEPMVVPPQAHIDAEAVVAAAKDEKSTKGDDPQNSSAAQLAQRVLELSNDDTHSVTSELLRCVAALRARLSIERNPPIAEVVQVTGIVERLTNLMRDSPWPVMKFECAWSLSNIASSTTAHTRAVVEANAVSVFVANLNHGNEDVVEQSIWALGNIAGDSPKYRDLVISSGVIPPIIQLCVENSKLTMLRNAVWAISNFCRGKPRPDFHILNTVLPVLARLIHSTDEEVLTDACWALSYLSDGTNQQIQTVIEVGICRRMVELLMHKNPSIKTPALRTVGNICTGDDMQTQIVINCSALPCLLALLASPKKGIRKEACWTLSNITSGNRNQIEQVINASIIPMLVKCFRDDDPDVQKEAAWALSNASAGASVEHIQYLANQGVIELFCLILDSSDSKMVNLALDALKNFLRASENSIYIELIESADGPARLKRVLDAKGDFDEGSTVKELLTYFKDTQNETTAS